MRSRHLPVLVLAALWACGGGAESVKKTPKQGPIDAGIELAAEEDVGVKRDVEFTTEDGVIIRGTFRPSEVRQAQTETSDGVVLLVHQLGSTRAEWIAFEAALVDTHSVLSIDMRGHGESQYKSDASTLDREAFTDADWKKTVLDVRAAVLYLRDLQPPPASITLVGSSIGSSAVLLYGVDDQEIDSMVLLSPGLSYRGMDTLSAAKKLGARRTLMLASTGDKASAEAVKRLARRLPGTKARVFKGSGHGVSISGPIVQAVVEFVKATPAGNRQ